MITSPLSLNAVNVVIFVLKIFCGLQNFYCNLTIRGKKFHGQDCYYYRKSTHDNPMDNGYNSFVTNKLPHFWIPTEGEISSETTNQFDPFAVIDP